MRVNNIPVELDGKVILYLNGELIHRMHLSDETVQKIINLHKFKYLLFKKMEQCSEEDLPLWNEYVVACEYALQRAWGLTEDGDYHRHWLTPRCKCPKDGGQESFGYYSIYSRDCPVHKYLIKQGLS